MKALTVIFIILFLFFISTNTIASEEETHEEETETWKIIGNSWNGTFYNTSTSSIDPNLNVEDWTEDEHNKKVDPRIISIDDLIGLCSFFIGCLLVLLYVKQKRKLKKKIL